MHPVEALIRNKIYLSGKIKKGWNQILCKVCNDHGKKGLRAGFRFDPDIGYNCFNCGAKFRLKHTSTTGSRELYRILDSYGITEDEVNVALIDVASINGIENLLEQKQKPSILQDPTAQNPSTIQLPPQFYRLPNEPESSNVLVALACAKLLERKIDPTSYPFMLTTSVDQKDKWVGRLIIPIYKDGKLIFYTGRDMLDQSPSKYINCDVTRENVLFGFDRLFVDSDQPLYVTEGIFDAMLVDGAAVLTNTMTQGQIKWLNKSHRKKVIIPDFSGRGYVLAKEAIQQGWGVSVPDFGSTKDVTEAMVSFGKIFTMKTIQDNTFTGFEAEMRIELLIKHDDKRKDSRVHQTA